MINKKSPVATCIANRETKGRQYWFIKSSQAFSITMSRKWLQERVELALSYLISDHDSFKTISSVPKFS